MSTGSKAIEDMTTTELENGIKEAIQMISLKRDELIGIPDWNNSKINNVKGDIGFYEALKTKYEYQLDLLA